MGVAGDSLVQQGSKDGPNEENGDHECQVHCRGYQEMPLSRSRNKRALGVENRHSIVPDQSS